MEHNTKPLEGSVIETDSVIAGSPRDRFRGALVGLAVGDAVGAMLEFLPPGTFDPITDLHGGGVHGVRAGEWTDDTAMALCLATSLVECRGFDPDDQMERYDRWFRQGYLSCTGTCKDIGNTVRAALLGYEASGDPFSGSTAESTAGNGSLMRLAPIPMRFCSSPDEAISLSGESSRTTHQAPQAIDACRYFGGLLVRALCGADKSDLVSSDYSPDHRTSRWEHLHPSIRAIAQGSFLIAEPPTIRSSGYVVDTLEAALWAFHRTVSFREGCLLAVNLGNDADTTGAVYGQLAGAFYGYSGIPASWREKLVMREKIVNLADRLYEAQSDGD